MTHPGRDDDRNTSPTAKTNPAVTASAIEADGDSIRGIAATIEELLQAYPGKIRFCFRHNPLPHHPQAALAAEAALAAGGQNKFWDMHDKLFENMRSLDRADLERYAQELGLDMARFKQALDSHAYQIRVDLDRELAAKIGVPHKARVVSRQMLRRQVECSTRHEFQSAFGLGRWTLVLRVRRNH